MTKKGDKEELVKEEGLTYEDYARLPEDGPRYELADGKLELMSPAPSPEHQRIGVRLLFLLQFYCGNEFILLNAPIDVILAPDEVRQPDLLMVHKSREDIITPRGVEGPPDLVVEILSPSTALKDRFVKSEVYARFGVKEYWLVDIYHRTLEQYLLEEGASAYRFHRAFGEEDDVDSPTVSCIHFLLKNIFSKGNLLSPNDRKSDSI